VLWETTVGNENKTGKETEKRGWWERDWAKYIRNAFCPIFSSAI